MIESIKTFIKAWLEDLIAPVNSYVYWGVLLILITLILYAGYVILDKKWDSFSKEPVNYILLSAGITVAIIAAFIWPVIIVIPMAAVPGFLIYILVKRKNQKNK